MNSSPKQQVNISNGGVDRFFHKMVETAVRSEKQKDIIEERIAIKKELAKSERYAVWHHSLCFLMCLGCLCAFFAPEAKTRKAGAITGAVSMLVDTGVLCLRSKRDKKLKQRIAHLNEQERDFF